MTTTTKTAGEKIETAARITYAGSALAHNMGFETPLIRFELADGRQVLWHSEAAYMCRRNLSEGAEVTVKGFLYGNNLRRVTVTCGNLIFGKGGK